MTRKILFAALALMTFVEAKAMQNNEVLQGNDTKSEAAVVTPATTTLITEATNQTPKEGVNQAAGQGDIATIVANRGDVNDDGEIDTQDAIRVIQFYLHKIELDGKQQKAADVNGDGNIDTNDAIQIIKMYLGKQ